MNDDQGNPASATIVKSIPHPISNHNGGTLAFSPIDGHLYFAVGDGGSSCDPGGGVGNAQNLASDLGKLHRLGVDSLPASTAGNPFDGIIAGNDSIWAYGLRNPYRFSFDRVTGAIYIGDVGQGAWEEVDCSPGTGEGGQNYGWVNMEGDHCPNASCGAQNPCPPAAYAPPIREYSQAGLPCSVIGGSVYRGCRMQALQGTYFYSDVCDDFVKTFRTNASCQVTSSPPDVNRENDLEPGGAVAIASIVAFGEDERGELYIVDWGSIYGGGANCATPPCGEVYKIIPNLSIVEVSGQGATPFTMGDAWSWENLPALSAIPVAFYRVVRSIGDPLGPFTCIHRQPAASASWASGDADTPASGQAFYYLVIAESASGELSHPGTWTDGTVRDVDHGAPCPL